MDRQSSTPAYIRIVIAVLAAISILFSVLYILEHNRNVLQKVSLSRQEITIQNLQQQLDALKEINSELAKNYIQVQEHQKDTQLELQELIGQDWEKKYEAALSEKNSLSDEYVRTNIQQNIDIDRLERANKFLSRENNSLKKSLTTQTEANEQLLITMEEIEGETRKLKNTVAKLSKPPETTPPPEPETPVKQSANKDEQATVANDKSGAYRHVRLQSLKNTMANQDSAIRSKILISVIPTIPDGITGNEFLSLTDNMKSEDILAVIKNTHQYINRPLDNSVITALAGRLNEADIATAEPIIFSPENSEKKQQE